MRAIRYFRSHSSYFDVIQKKKIYCQFSQDKTEANVITPPLKSIRPSLAHIILSLESNVAKQQALQHVLNALFIMQARNAVVTALQSHIAQTCVKGNTSPEAPPDGTHGRLSSKIPTSGSADDINEALGGSIVGTMSSSTGPTVRWGSNDVIGGEIAQGGGEGLANASEVANLVASPRATPESEEYPLAVFPSISSSASLSSRASKMSSSSAMSVIAATLTSNAQVVGEVMNSDPGLDEFTSQVSTRPIYHLLLYLRCTA